MEEQRFLIRGVTYAANDPGLQHALGLVYETPERPRCICVRGGIEMYIAKHSQYVVKRMPNTGQSHHPSCPSYETDRAQSGPGGLIGEAIIVPSPEPVGQ